AFTKENVTKHSNDPLLSGEDRMKLEELIKLCTNLQQRVIDIETTKTTQRRNIASLKRRVKKLEKKNKSRTHKLKRLYKVGLSRRVESSNEASLGDQEDASKQGRKIDDIDAHTGITLVDETQGRHDDDLMFDTSVLNDEEVFARQDIAENTTAATITTVELTLDKGKGIMVEEPLKMKKKDQISFEEQEAIRLQDEFDKEIETDYEMAQRLHVEEQEELTIKEKSKLFVQLFKARKKHFAAKRAEEKRNRPPTKAQQRSIMCTYLKNMAGWKPKDLKNKSFANIVDPKPRSIP
ncbi:hypothetical protein Tco_1573675, partial [Tanacetum coccineum]